MAADKLKIKYRSTASLVPYARNSRNHSEAQVAQIAASIKEFGFTNPVLIDGEGGIIAGHGRVLAAQVLELAEVPTIELANLTDDQKRAYVIVDNQLALNSTWNEELLKLELHALDQAKFDLGLLGFEPGELRDLMFGAGLGDDDDGDPRDDQGKYAEQYGVIVMCGNAAEQEQAYNALVEQGYNCKVVCT